MGYERSTIKGIYYNELKSKYNSRKERSYRLIYKYKGVRYEEALGKETDGITLDVAEATLVKRKTALRMNNNIIKSNNIYYFKDFADYFFDNKILDKKTECDFKGIYKNYLSRFDDKRVDEITGRHIESFFLSINNRTNTTINKYTAVLSTIYNYNIVNLQLDSLTNPVEMFKKLKRQSNSKSLRINKRNREKFLTKTEIQRLREDVKYKEIEKDKRTDKEIEYNIYDELIFDMLIFTGARIMAVLTIKFKHLLLNTREIKLYNRKKGLEDDYTIPMADELKKSVHRYFDHHSLNTFDQDDYLFSKKDQRDVHLAYNTTQKRLQKRLDRLYNQRQIIKNNEITMVTNQDRVSKIVAYTLRHSLGSLVTQEKGIKMAQLLLNHSNISTTQIYSHDSDKNKRDALNSSFEIKDDTQED